MRFRNDNLPVKKELTDTIAEEHPKRFVAVAEEQIRAMHHHQDGSSVELHEIGSKEFIQQSIQTSLEGKLAGSSNDWQPQQNPQNNLAAAKIEYEKTHFDSSRRGPVAAAMRESSQNQPQQLYGAQQSVTGGISHSQETAMVGCNCGLEWTVTGQSTKAQGAEGVKIEQYGHAAGKGAAGYNASVGGGPGEYRGGSGAGQDYTG